MCLSVNKVTPKVVAGYDDIFWVDGIWVKDEVTSFNPTYLGKIRTPMYVHTVP